MPPKMFTCAICGQEVSKRKSLDLHELNGQEGRACRDHEEVQNLVELKAAREKEQRKLTAANEAIFIMFAVAEIRVRNTLFGMPPEIFYFQFRKNKVPKHVIAKVQAKIEEMGAKMSPGEMAVSLATGLSMRKRMQEMEERKAASM